MRGCRPSRESLRPCLQGGTWGPGGEIQRLSGVDLLSNNPDKSGQLEALGLVIRRRVPTAVHATGDNPRYLRAKVDHTGHTIALGALAG